MSTNLTHLPSTAPTHPHPKSTAPLSTLLSARISFRLPSPLAQYDQAGLLLSLRHQDAAATRNPTTTTTTSGTSPPPPPPKWIKTGVEFYNGTPRAATVACDSWADWSLSPITTTSSDAGWVTVAVENGVDELGKSLWVYQVASGGEKIPLREVCWPFGHGGGDEWEVGVEAYACRPSKEASEELVVEFRDFEVKWV